MHKSIHKNKREIIEGKKQLKLIGKSENLYSQWLFFSVYCAFNKTVFLQNVLEKWYEAISMNYYISAIIYRSKEY